MRKWQLVFEFSRAQAFGIVAVGLCVASTMAMAATCYCGTGLVSACEGKSPPLIRCGQPGSGCQKDTGNSDSILLTTTSPAYGQIGTTGGAMGKCSYYNGKCTAGGDCDVTGASTGSTNVQSNSPSGGISPPTCNLCL